MITAATAWGLSLQLPFHAEPNLEVKKQIEAELKHKWKRENIY
jgi:hypothetical protein